MGEFDSLRMDLYGLSFGLPSFVGVGCGLFEVSTSQGEKVTLFDPRLEGGAFEDIAVCEASLGV